MKFLDYYQVLGVPRGADADAIKKAFRKLARKYHPDVSKSPEAETRFKEANEAYEVLSDPEKRKRYDALGPNWKAGQSFTPPPGFGGFKGASSGPGGFSFQFGDAGEFSDFFSALFGDLGASRSRRRASPFGDFGAGTDFADAFQPRGQDIEVGLSITIEDLYNRAPKSLSLQVPVTGPDGTVTHSSRSFNVRIPPGATEGTRIRLSGQGHAGGNLYIKLHVRPHPVYRLNGHDLELTLAITPWEAALGAKIPVQTLSGTASVTIPPGTSSEARLRLAGQGLPKRQGRGGDLLITVRIVVPKQPTSREKQLFEQLAADSSFRPRAT